MDPNVLKVILDAVHTGGQGALMVLIYVGWSIGKKAGEALETLKRIEMRMIDDRAMLKESDATVKHRLETLHDDMQALPLQILRHMRAAK